MSDDTKDEYIGGLIQDAAEERDNLRYLLRKHGRHHPECIASARFLRLRSRMIDRLLRDE